MARQDIALLDNDLVMQNGDFVVGQSDEQHIQDTINASPGWWKENPLDGVGIIQYLNSTGTDQQLARAIKIQLQSDGYTVNNPLITRDGNGNLMIQPNATII